MRTLADAQAVGRSRLHHSPEARLGRVTTGDLLRLAEVEFELFMTSDQNLRYQQNLAERSIPIIVLSANDLRRILSAAAEIQAAIARISPGEFRQLQIP